MPSISRDSTVAKGYGLQASTIGFLLPLQVLESGADFYIGTFSAEEGPVSRESEEYYRSRENAQQALDNNSWTQRYHY